MKLIKNLNFNLYKLPMKYRFTFGFYKPMSLNTCNYVLYTFKYLN